MSNKIFQFGEYAEGYNIPVLNEREIRAAAGILFVFMFISVMFAILKADFFLLKYAITFFFTDICIRVLVNPRFAPSLILGRLIVRSPCEPHPQLLPEWQPHDWSKDPKPACW